MSAPEDLVNELSQPIPGESPCGLDLAFSAEFDAIAELRRADDPTLDQGEWVTALKVADWRGVETACAELLRHRTKDLRVAGWWGDARARLQGFAGLAEGLALTQRLIDGHWPALHPLPDDDGDLSLRSGAIGWLLARVQDGAQDIVLAEHDGQRCTARDLITARARQQEVARGVREASELGADGALTLERAHRIAQGAGPARFAAVRSDAQRARDALTALEHSVDHAMAAEGPAFGPARQAMDDLLDLIERLGRDAGLQAAASASPLAAAGGSGAQPAAGAASSAFNLNGPLQSRAQALEQLRQVAAFFRQTEPHSPVAYLADKAARWGEMPLHLWLRSVVKDGGSLAALEELLGTERPEPRDGDD